jgi:hypothetical protein
MKLEAAKPKPPMGTVWSKLASTKTERHMFEEVVKVRKYQSGQPQPPREPEE